MAVLRTRRLGHGEIWTIAEDMPTKGEKLAYTSDIYVCPAGSRAVVRDIRVHTYVAAEAPCVFKVRTSGGILRSIWQPVLTATVSEATHQCDVVLEPGDALVIDTDFGYCDWYVSGAEMPIPG